MNLEIRNAFSGQEYEFAELRARAMRPSLEVLGRYNEVTVRERLLNDYKQMNTKAIFIQDKLIGFYSLEIGTETVILSHLYIDPLWSGKGIGSQVLTQIINSVNGKTIKLRALKESSSNQFYMNHGFVKVSEEEYDVNYEYTFENLK